MWVRALLEGAVSTALESEDAVAESIANEPSFQEADEDAGGTHGTSLVIMCQIWLIVLAFVLGQLLDRRNVHWMSEAGMALIIGVGMGVVVKFTASEGLIAKYDFSTDLFFILLLPPIIFEAGFNLQVGAFFSNIGAICVYAFLGTTISTFVIALIMWAAGATHAVASLGLLECLIFGAIVSATDPVTVLAVFSKLRADEDLHALIFGESVMNDAVAIVLYKTLMRYLTQPLTFVSMLSSTGFFMGVFLGSMAIGSAYGLFSAIIFRTGWLRSDHVPLEASVTLLLGFSSYYTAEAAHLSGIVAILFCGIVMAKYARRNLTRRAEARTRGFLKITAAVSELFVFIYIGASLFLERQAWSDGLTWTFLIFALFALAVSRAANIVPLTHLINFFRPTEMHIPRNFQFMMWWSGLRGAIAFALALEAGEDMRAPGGGPSDAAVLIRTTTFFIVLITVLINGGSTASLLSMLKLKQDDYQAMARHSSIRTMQARVSSLPREPSHDDGTPGALHAPNGSRHGDALVAAASKESLPAAGSTGGSRGGSRGGDVVAAESGGPHEDDATGALAVGTHIVEALRNFSRNGGIVKRYEAVDVRLSQYLTRQSVHDTDVQPGQRDALDIELQPVPRASTPEAAASVSKPRGSSRRTQSAADILEMTNGAPLTRTDALPTPSRLGTSFPEPARQAESSPLPSPHAQAPPTTRTPPAGSAGASQGNAQGGGPAPGGGAQEAGKAPARELTSSSQLPAEPEPASLMTHVIDHYADDGGSSGFDVDVNTGSFGRQGSVRSSQALPPYASQGDSTEESD